MSEIAERAGIGRATLYEYFADVQAILTAWHDRQVTRHLHHLVDIRDQADGGDRLEAVLLAYARLSRHEDASGLAAALHRREHVDRARQQLRDFLRNLLTDGVASGSLRDDVPPDELAGFVLNALSAAGGLRSEAAVRRLVNVTLAGLCRRV